MVGNTILQFQILIHYDIRNHEILLRLTKSQLWMIRESEHPLNFRSMSRFPRNITSQRSPKCTVTIR